MSEVKKYKLLAQALVEAKGWAALFGAEFHGGGGGRGSLHALQIAEAVIYHQEYNGARNYHDAPNDMVRALERSIKKNFRLLLDDALEDMRQQAQAQAKLALRENEKLMAAAGLEVLP